MKLLFIGDTVGKCGCEFLQKNVSTIKNKYNTDLTVINGENSAAGNGITEASADMLFSAGADVITTGNHCFRQKSSLSVFERYNVIRPANYPEGNPGKGVCIVDCGRWSAAVVNLQGTAFLEPLDNPFGKIDKILEDLSGIKNIFVDFHAESTAEKKAMGHYLTERVTAVLGTHTHVQTADEEILKGYTAYITDAGMTGAAESVIGTEIKQALDRFRFRYAERFREASGRCILNAVIVDFNEKTGAAADIKRIYIKE